MKGIDRLLFKNNLREINELEELYDEKNERLFRLQEHTGDESVIADEIKYLVVVLDNLAELILEDKKELIKKFGEK